MSSCLDEPLLDLEAARGGDVLEVDAPEPGRERPYDRHDLVGVLRVQADREGVDAGELLEQHRLALHHRHRRARADVAQAEHRGAVGHDRDRVALDRVLERLVGVVGDRAGIRARRPACRPSTGRRGSSAGSCSGSRSCPRRAAGRCGRWCRARARPAPRRRRPVSRGQSDASPVSTVMSRIVCSRWTCTRSTAPIVPPASPIALATRPSIPGRCSISTRRVRLY